MNVFDTRGKPTLREFLKTVDADQQINLYPIGFSLDRALEATLFREFSPATIGKVDSKYLDYKVMASGGRQALGRFSNIY